MCTTTTPTPAPNLAQIRGEYQAACYHWVGLAEEGWDPCEYEYWRECPADAPAVANHAREAMAAAEHGDLRVAADHALEACVRARPFGLVRTSSLRGLYDSIRAAISILAIREAYRSTLSMRIGGSWSLAQASECASDAMAAVERAVQTRPGAPLERRGMARAQDLARSAADAAQQGKLGSAASYSHFYDVIRGVVDGVDPLTHNP